MMFFFWNRPVRILLGSFVLGVAISFAACAPAAPARYPFGSYAGTSVANCRPGTYNVRGLSCVNAVNSNFSATCAYAGGVMVQVSGAQACKTVTPYFTQWSAIPGVPVHRLSPAAPGSAGAYMGTYQQLQVARGDVLAVTSASGGWSINDYTCTGAPDVSVTGQAFDSSSGLGGDGQGLGASDGVSYYPVGESATVQIQNSGLLRFGFNIPNNVQATCDSASIQFTLSSCRDASGNSYYCQ